MSKVIRGVAYVSGPYSIGDPVLNTRAAIDAGNRLADAGYTVIIPHLSHFWHMIHPHDWNFWLMQDMVLVTRCDLLVRLPGESKGADMEEAVARANNIPVLTLEEAVRDQVSS